MFKKSLTKILVTTAMCTMLVAGSVSAASRPTFNFTLGNTGKDYTHISSTYNKKEYISNPWTLKVKSITCLGKNGIRFAPVQYNSSTGKNVKVCTESSYWRNSTGYATVKFSSNDAKLTNYKLAARQDDDYYSTFKASGWFNADTVSDQ